MSREIKFRIWDTLENTYHLVDLMEFYSDGSVEGAWLRGKLTGQGYYPVEYIVIEQYTGLKDKNSKEIYEGDIVEAKGIGRFEVEWYKGVAGFMFAPNMYMKYHIPFNSSTTLECEVIGNIHENPKLLEGEE